MNSKPEKIEPIVTERELVFQNKEKEKRAKELTAIGEVYAPEWVRTKRKKVDSIQAAKNRVGINTSLIIALCSLFYPQALNAQTTYFLNDTVNVAVSMSGTSTLHDWTMTAKNLSGEAQFAIVRKNITQVSSLVFSLPVKSLKSSEKMLDNNAYEALKADTYRYIVFTLTSSRVDQGLNNLSLIKAVGNLNIAGVSKETAMDVQCQVHKDKKITCKASKKLKMTDFDVKPPSFMMGLMKTGDEITLDFQLSFLIKPTLTQKH